jgi:serine/threonine protein kinase
MVWTNRFQEFALKRIRLDSGTKAELSAVEVMCMPNRPNAHIVKVYEFWFQKDIHKHTSQLTIPIIRMELCSGTLRDYLAQLSKSSLIGRIELTEIMIQILTGLYYCHVQSYCHRDLKLQNGNSVTFE